MISKNHKVSSMYLFGSAIGDKFIKGKSDYDFLVEFTPEYFDGYTENYEELKSALEQLLHNKVDIISLKSIQNKILLESINASKELIYD